MDVIVKDNDLEYAMKLLKKKLSKERMVQDLRRHKFFMSKPERRRQKDGLAEKRRKKDERRARG